LYFAPVINRLILVWQEKQIFFIGALSCLT
jgi:hypothetical protein